MSQNQETFKYSKMFMFLPSTLDRKEEIQQYNDNVHLHPVDLSYDQLKVININKDFDNLVPSASFRYKRKAKKRPWNASNT